MCTVLLAWINSKYNKDYELLFLGAVIIDFELVQGITEIIVALVK